MCKIVQITKISEHEFKKYPEAKTIQDFDPSDKKFVTVANVENFEPIIVNATDSDWYYHFKAFEDIGLKILFLCDDEKNKWNENSA